MSLALENTLPLPPSFYYLPSKFRHILDQILPEQFRVLRQSTLLPSLPPESSQVFALGPKRVTKTAIKYKRQGSCSCSATTTFSIFPRQVQAKVVKRPIGGTHTRITIAF
jgi:hypothetical protein